MVVDTMGWQPFQVTILKNVCHFCTIAPLCNVCHFVSHKEAK
jgi:hypothetical protein